ncbi:hypothetical protein TMU3MR103_1431 [Tetragenococcus muriaticus 3MR10-3]|uniref:Uncharacterized protein n=1 Tax=Tetragenococcus muriaticus 3MR10-3 TaxID=1302648 RepID=A0A091C1H3_9ENTE|nr:hypothetical protein TMU3MR103_1431 [Tetragenococcus muriaticus 3MR10-3]
MEVLEKTEIKNQGKSYSSKKKIIIVVFIFALVSFFNDITSALQA